MSVDCYPFRSKWGLEFDTIITRQHALAIEESYRVLVRLVVNSEFMGIAS